MCTNHRVFCRMFPLTTMFKALYCWTSVRTGSTCTSLISKYLLHPCNTYKPNSSMIQCFECDVIKIFDGKIRVIDKYSITALIVAPKWHSLVKSLSLSFCFTLPLPVCFCSNSVIRHWLNSAGPSDSTSLSFCYLINFVCCFVGAGMHWLHSADLQ